MSRIRFVFSIVTILAISVGVAGVAKPIVAQQSDLVVRVSVASDGTEAERASVSLSMSADSRYAVFASDASNLVEGDTNGKWDVFVHDRQEETTTRVSVNSEGEQANGSSRYTTISADGRYVGFSSLANNLVEEDANDKRDIFVHDYLEGTTMRVSVNSKGEEGSDLSIRPIISADGRHVAFDSRAHNLVIGDTNDAADVFVHDRQTGETVRVSVASDGTQANNVSFIGSISSDGRHVAFTSYASNLVARDTNGNQDSFVGDILVGQLSGSYSIYLPLIRRTE